jgi:hypothetical protein
MSSGDAAARVGAVYNFGDSNNFNEVTISPTGVARLRTVTNGIPQLISSTIFTAPRGANKWVHLNVVRRNTRMTVKVDGVPVFSSVAQGGGGGTKAGLVARNTRAVFDDYVLLSSGRTNPYIEDFDDAVAEGWVPIGGNWSSATAMYVNQRAEATSMALSPVTTIGDFGEAPFPRPYTFKVRMMNPYGGAGNLVGVVLRRSDGNLYHEIVFSPRGEAQMNRVEGSVRTRLATAQYAGGGQKQWFDVEVTSFGDFNGGVGHVKVNGITVFDELPGDDIRGGAIGLITHWSPGEFDDVRVVLGRIFRPVTENFDSGQPSWLLPGPQLWSFEGGTAHSGSISPAEHAIIDRPYEATNIEFRLRMSNHFGASANLVGVVYGRRELGDWYEATFSPTGVARLTRVRQGITTVLATAPYAGGNQHAWFEVQLVLRNQLTTVRVNGVTVFNEVRQPDLGAHWLGLVTHWTNAEFDDLSITQVP